MQSLLARQRERTLLDEDAAGGGGEEEVNESLSQFHWAKEPFVDKHKFTIRIHSHFHFLRTHVKA